MSPPSPCWNVNWCSLAHTPFCTNAAWNPLPAPWEQEGAIDVYSATGHARTEEAGWTIIIRPHVFTEGGEDAQTPLSFCHVLSASSDKASPFGLG